jgi:hypothetical protein
MRGTILPLSRSSSWCGALLSTGTTLRSIPPLPIRLQGVVQRQDYLSAFLHLYLYLYHTLSSDTLNLFCTQILYPYIKRSGIAQSVWRRAKGWTAGVRFPAGARFFFSPQRPDRLWGPPSLLSNRYPRGGGALSPGAMRLGREADHSPPLWSYFNSPISLHGIVLN